MKGFIRAVAQEENDEAETSILNKTRNKILIVYLWKKTSLILKKMECSILDETINEINFYVFFSDFIKHWKNNYQEKCVC